MTAVVDYTGPDRASAISVASGRTSATFAEYGDPRAGGSRASPSTERYGSGQQAALGEVDERSRDNPGGKRSTI